MNRPSLSRRLRFAVLHRDNFSCRYCGRSPWHGVRLEVDHVLPVAEGGKDEIENLVTACWDCNRGKRHYMLERGARATLDNPSDDYGPRDEFLYTLAREAFGDALQEAYHLGRVDERLGVTRSRLDADLMAVGRKLVRS